MRSARKFARLSGAERRLVLDAWVTVALFRGALTVLPFRWVRDRAHAARRRTSAGRLPADRYSWAVTVASRRVPKATCLTQALALQSLLTRAGYESDLRIGVATSDAGRFEAHAWLESEGRILIGGDVGRFTVLTPDARAAR